MQTMFTSQLSSQQHRLAAWLSAFALMLMTFAPLISQALELPNSANEQVVCTQFGVKHIPASQPSHHAPMIVLDHCAYCSLSSDQAWMGQDNAILNPYLLLQAAHYLPAYRAPLVLAFYQTSHPPHAPPTLST